MECYGIRGVALQWFISYLSNRSHSVQIGDICSNYLHLTCGVPQGSIAGTLLFLVYINDIVKVSAFVDFLMFADDTNLLISSHSLESLSVIAITVLAKLAKWFRLNKLSLNVNKTNYILFHNNRKKLLTQIKLTIDNITIEQTDKAQFLRIIINQNLTLTDHISLLKNKISKNIGVIRRIRKNLTLYTLRMSYYALINPYFDYCNIVWGIERNVHLEKLV